MRVRFYIASILPTVIGLLCACSGAGGGSVPPDHGLTLDPASSPQTQAALAVDSLEPEEIEIGRASCRERVFRAV